MKNPLGNADDLGDIIRKSMDEITAVAKRINPPTGQKPVKEGEIVTASADTSHSVATRSAKQKGKKGKKDKQKVNHQWNKDQVSYKKPDKTNERMEQIKQTGITQSENAVNKMTQNVNPVVGKTANASFGHGNLTGRDTGKALGRSDAIEEVKPVLKKKDKKIKVLKTVVKVGTPVTGLGWYVAYNENKGKKKAESELEKLKKKYNAK